MNISPDLLASKQADFSEYADEDTVYHDAVEKLESDLQFGYPVKRLDRAYVPNFDFGMAGVVVVGQDGLVANVAKYVGDVPIVAVNPEPQSSSGVLVCNSAGSTGWISSVFNRTAGVAKFLGSHVPIPQPVAWAERQLLWAVREPFRFGIYLLTSIPFEISPSGACQYRMNITNEKCRF